MKLRVVWEESKCTETKRVYQHGKLFLKVHFFCLLPFLNLGVWCSVLILHYHVRLDFPKWCILLSLIIKILCVFFSPVPATCFTRLFNQLYYIRDNYVLWSLSLYTFSHSRKSKCSLIFCIPLCWGIHFFFLWLKSPFSGA